MFKFILVLAIVSMGIIATGVWLYSMAWIIHIIVTTVFGG